MAIECSPGPDMARRRMAGHPNPRNTNSVPGASLGGPCLPASLAPGTRDIGHMSLRLYQELQLSMIGRPVLCKNLAFSAREDTSIGRNFRKLNCPETPLINPGRRRITIKNCSRCSVPWPTATAPCRSLLILSRPKPYPAYLWPSLCLCISSN